MLKSFIFELYFMNPPPPHMWIITQKKFRFMAILFGSLNTLNEDYQYVNVKRESIDFIWL